MTLKYKNSTIHYTIEGKGKAVVLLHGFLENIDMWNAIVPGLSHNYQVVCIDLLGHGKTNCIGYVHTMDDMAEAVAVVLNELKIKNAHFIGHSMGGYVALALAEIQPQLFKGLCLMNSTFEADDEERKELRTRANTMVQTNFESIVKLSFANLFAPKSKETFKSEYEAALQLALKTPVQGYIAAQEGMKLRPNRFDLFKNLNCKKAIIIGKKDSVINGNEIINKISLTDIEFIEFSEGHMSHIENISELSHFLKHFA